jgi:hypothetical protein
VGDESFRDGVFSSDGLRVFAARSDFIFRFFTPDAGVVRVAVRGDRVLPGGQAVTVSRVELTPAAAGD